MVKYPENNSVLSWTSSQLDYSQKVWYELLNRLEDFVVTSLFDRRSRMSFDYEDSVLSSVLIDSVNKRFKSGLSKDVECPDRFVFDDFANIAKTSSHSLTRIFRDPSTNLVRIKEMVDINKAQHFGPDTTKWLSQRPGKSLAEKLGNKNRILSSHPIFTKDTKENQETIYLYDNLYWILGRRVNNSKCYSCSNKECFYHDKFDELKRLFDSYFAVKNNVFDGVQRKKQDTPNNKLISDQYYKMIWESVSQLSMSDAANKDKWENLGTSFISVVLLVVASELLKKSNVFVQEHYGSVKFDVDCGYAFAKAGKSLVLENHLGSEIRKITLIAEGSHLVIQVKRSVLGNDRIYSRYEDFKTFEVSFSDQFTRIDDFLNGSHLSATLSKNCISYDNYDMSFYQPAISIPTYEGLFAYIEQDKRYKSNPSILASFKYCIDFFSTKANFLSFDKKEQRDNKELISKKRNKFSNVDKKKLIDFNDYYRIIDDYLATFSKKENQDDSVSYVYVESPVLEPIFPESILIDDSYDVSETCDLKYQKVKINLYDGGSFSLDYRYPFSISAVSYNDNGVLAALTGGIYPIDTQEYSSKVYQELLCSLSTDINEICRELGLVDERKMTDNCDLRAFDIAHNLVHFRNEGKTAIRLGSGFGLMPEKNGFRALTDKSVRNLSSYATPYSYFLEDSEVHGESVKNIIKKFITEEGKKYKRTGTTLKDLCLIPDIVDEFDTDFRKMIYDNGYSIFAVPHSILYALEAMHNNPLLKSGSPFYILSLEYEEPSLYGFQYSHTEDVLIRKRRYDCSLNIKYSDLVKLYMDAYASKYGIGKLTENELMNLSSSRLLDKVISLGRDVKFDRNGNNGILISLDEAALLCVRNKLVECLSTVKKDLALQGGNATVVLASSFGGGMTDSINAFGCSAAINLLFSRHDKELPLWKDELPKIDIVVENENGDKVTHSLFGDKTNTDVISQSVRGSGASAVEYEIDGLYYLKALNDDGEPADHTDIRVVRSSLVGKRTKNKNAVFVHNEFFKDDLPVHLKLVCDYSSENVYKLVAKSTESDKLYESEWREKTIVSKVNAKSQEPDSDDISRVFGDSRYCYSFKALVSLADSTRTISQELLKKTNKSRHYSLFRVFASEECVGLLRKRYPSLSDDIYDLLRLYAKYRGNTEIKKQLAEYISAFALIPVKSKTIFKDSWDMETEFDKLFADFVKDQMDMGLDGYKNLLRISRLIEKDEDDHYGIFKVIDSKSHYLDGDKVYASIAECSFLTHSWVNHLYRHSPQIVHRSYNYVLEETKKFDCLRFLKQHENYEITKRKSRSFNGREYKISLSKLRDYLEFLLCVIKVRTKENGILWPEDDKTKAFMKKLDSLAAGIRECESLPYSSELSASDYQNPLFRERIETSKKNSKDTDTIVALKIAIAGEEAVTLKYKGER